MNHIPSPDISDPGIERLIQAKGKTAPRITPGDVEDAIASEHYFTARDGVFGSWFSSDSDDAYESEEPDALDLLTFCTIVLRNGFTVTGESACASPENFDAEIGKRIARNNALQKIWPLLGYTLREQLHQEKLALATTWQQRVLEEYSELVIKLDKLTTFLASDHSKQVDDVWLLHEQAKSMADYAGVLHVRIRNFKEIA